jgi:hypothetical protein
MPLPWPDGYCFRGVVAGVSAGDGFAGGPPKAAEACEAEDHRFGEGVPKFRERGHPA